MASRETLTFLAPCAAVAALAAIIVGYPNPKLDWDGTLLPMAKRSFHNSEKPLQGIIVVITGCTNGIGKALAVALKKKLGASIIGISRTESRLQKMRNDGVLDDYFVADFTDVAAVAKAGKRLKEKYSHVDILVNNAGMTRTVDNFWGDKVSQQGYDDTFAVNHLSHVLLTEVLGDTLSTKNKTDIPSRVVQISSTFHWLVDGHALAYTGNNEDLPIAARPGGSPGGMVFRGLRAYANSKLAQILHARALRRRWKYPTATLPRFVSICPTWVSTDIAGASGPGNWCMKMGFPANGFGIASALTAILDDKDTTDGDYYTNVEVPSFFGSIMNHGPVWFKHSLLRDAFGTCFVAPFLLWTQKFFARVSKSKTSTLSYNESLQDELYDWSYAAIQKFL